VTGERPTSRLRDVSGAGNSHWLRLGRRWGGWDPEARRP